MSDRPALRLLRLRPDATEPRYATEGAAGLDLSAALDTSITIAPGDHAMISTGWAMAIPAGYEGQVRPRSGLAARHRVTVLNAPGTIDSDYRGEICILLVNLGDAPFVVEHGARIAQLVITPVTRVELRVADALDGTTRGDAGFGSTGL
jgi:dUTP pyrophosphatase